MIILGIGGLLGDAAAAVLKDGELVAAVEAVRAGQTFFTPKVAGMVLERHWKRVKKQPGKVDHANPMKKH